MRICHGFLRGSWAGFLWSDLSCLQHPSFRCSPLLFFLRKFLDIIVFPPRLSRGFI